MAGKNWQAGGKIPISAQGVVYLIATVVPWEKASAVSDNFVPAGYIGATDPRMVWEVLIGGIVASSFLAAIALWILSALRKVKRSQLRRNAFITSSLNSLNQGVVMTDSSKRVVFCNDRYLEIYGATRSDIPRNITGPQLLEMGRERGMHNLSSEYFYQTAKSPEGLVTELPDGRSILVR